MKVYGIATVGCEHCNAGAKWLRYRGLGSGSVFEFFADENAALNEQRVQRSVGKNCIVVPVDIPDPK